MTVLLTAAELAAMRTVESGFLSESGTVFRLAPTGDERGAFSSGYLSRGTAKVRVSQSSTTGGGNTARPVGDRWIDNPVWDIVLPWGTTVQDDDRIAVGGKWYAVEAITEQSLETAVHVVGSEISEPSLIYSGTAGSVSMAGASVYGTATLSDFIGGTQHYTVEFWTYNPSYAQNYDGDAYFGVYAGASAAAMVGAYTGVGGNTYRVVTQTEGTSFGIGPRIAPGDANLFTLVDAAWNHIAFTQYTSGGSISSRIFENGVDVTDVYDWDTEPRASGTAFRYLQGTATITSGWVRISDYARYSATESFTPPSRLYLPPVDDNTLHLWNPGTAVFTDSGSGGVDLTLVGV